jgi:hypothetical protein
MKTAGVLAVLAAFALCSGAVSGEPAGAGGKTPSPQVWSAAEIQAGRADCDRRLSGLHVRFDKLEPIKEGACGLSAPIRLQGFDYDDAPNVAFSPAPIISCKLTEALRRWLDGTVQPEAKRRLDATVATIVTLSDYGCRMRYDTAAETVSQHGYANALDIGEFITAKGERISVLELWNAGDERAAFLHAVHAGACRIFGTTLGPEANEAHKNHFHLDMTERRQPLCDFTPEQIRAREQAAALARASEKTGSGPKDAQAPKR